MLSITRAAPNRTTPAVTGLLATLLVAAAPRAQDEAPNAAELYRRALTEVRRALRTDAADPVEMPYLGEELSPADFGDAPWSALLESTATARGLFAQATKVSRCRFDAKTDATTTELVESLPSLVDLHSLVLADAWRRLQRDPAAVLTIADDLLDHGLHLADDRAPIGVLFLLSLEDRAVALMRAAITRLPAGPEQGPTLREALRQLERHEAARPDLRGLADRMAAGARFSMSMLDDQVANDLLRRARAIAGEQLDAMFAPLRADDPPTVDAYREHCEATVARWREAIDKEKLSSALKSEIPEKLAAALCLLISPDAPRTVAEHARTTKALGEVRATLRDRLRGK